MALTRAEISRRYAQRHPDRVALRQARRWSSYYEANKAKIIARAVEWNKNNPAKRKAIRAKYYEANRTKEQQAQDRYRKENAAKYLFARARNRAQKTGLAFGISLEDVVIPAVCPLLHIPISSYSEDMNSRPSLDRLDSSKGYVKGNVHVVSHRANRLKNNACGDELMVLAINVLRLEGNLE